MGCCQPSNLSENHNKFYDELRQFKRDLNYKPIIIKEKFSYYAKSSFNDKKYEQKEKILKRIIPRLGNINESSLLIKRMKVKPEYVKESTKEGNEISSLGTEAGFNEQNSTMDGLIICIS
jgi:hypothetical protein